MKQVGRDFEPLAVGQCWHVREPFESLAVLLFEIRVRDLSSLAKLVRARVNQRRVLEELENTSLNGIDGDAADAELWSESAD